LLKSHKDIFSAIVNCDLESVRSLLGSSSCLEDRNDSGRTPLLESTMLGYEQIVNEILKHKPQLEAVDEDGSTALILGAGFSRNQIIIKLVMAGANVNGRNRDTGETALVRASGWGTVECVTTLLNLGANSNAHYGVTALMNTAFNNRVDCARVLLDWGASLDMIDKRGRTALYHAVAYQHFEIARLLADHGAAADSKDLEGVSPRMLANNLSDSRWSLLFS
jgi:ankyrin repeat protein